MHKPFIVLIPLIFQFSYCNIQPKANSKTINLLKIEMTLSAFGVESDNFPFIQGCVDFVHDSASFVKSYYNPAFKTTSYKLSHQEIQKVKTLFQNIDLHQLKSEYIPDLSDQPTSTIIIYTNEKNFIIKDSGLIGDYPLQDLYNLVYKF